MSDTLETSHTLMNGYFCSLSAATQEDACYKILIHAFTLSTNQMFQTAVLRMFEARGTPLSSWYHRESVRDSYKWLEIAFLRCNQFAVDHFMEGLQKSSTPVDINHSCLEVASRPAIGCFLNSMIKYPEKFAALNILVHKILCLDPDRAEQLLDNPAAKAGIVTAVCYWACHQKKWGLIKKLLRFDEARQADADAVSAALEGASRDNELATVHAILGLTGENQASVCSVETALFIVAGRIDELVMDQITSVGWRAPAVFKYTPSVEHNVLLEIVVALLKLSGSNQASQEAIRETFFHSSSSGAVAVIEKLFEVRGANGIKSNIIVEAFIQALKLTLPPLCNPVVKALFEWSENNEISASAVVGEALVRISGSDRDVWNVTRLLSLDKEYQVNATDVGRALIAAAVYYKRDVVVFLLDWKGTNQVNATDVGRALIAASSSGEGEMVKVLLDWKGVNQVDAQAVGPALIAAAASGKEWVVKVLFQQEKSRQVVNAETLGSALIAALSDYVITPISGLKAPAEKLSSAVTKALDGKKRLFRFLFSGATSIKCLLAF